MEILYILHWLTDYGFNVLQLPLTRHEGATCKDHLDYMTVMYSVFPLG